MLVAFAIALGPLEKSALFGALVLSGDAIKESHLRRRQPQLFEQALVGVEVLGAGKLLDFFLGQGLE